MVRLAAAFVILIVGTAGTDAVAQSASSQTPATSLSVSAAASVSASHNVRIRLRRFQQFSDAGIREPGTSNNRDQSSVRAVRLFTNGMDARVVVSYDEEVHASLAVRQDDPTLFASTNQSVAVASPNSSQLFVLPIPVTEATATRFITVTQ